MLYVNKFVGNTSRKQSKKVMKEQFMLQQNRELIIEIATRDVKSVFAYFKTTRNGLSMQEAKKRIHMYRKNELSSNIEMLSNVLVKMRKMLPGLAKSCMQRRTKQEEQALTVTVSRVEGNVMQGEPKMMELPIEDLVPGDLIFLATGDTVPADVRIIYAEDFLVNECMLTGKEGSVEKFESCYRLERKRFMPLKRMKDYNPLQLENVCFKGTEIVNGTAKAVVISTGNNTYSKLLNACCNK